MTVSLNREVLKRTHGLLAEIDLVCSLPTVAERVNRLIESAALPLYSWPYKLVNDEGVPKWEPDYETFDSWESPPNECGCQVVVRDGFTQYACRKHIPERANPFVFTEPPHNSLHRPAPYSCGGEGCKCEELFGRSYPERQAKEE